MNNIYVDKFLYIFHFRYGAYMSSKNKYFSTEEIEEKISSKEVRNSMVGGISVWPIVRSRIGSALNPAVIKRKKVFFAVFLAIKSYFTIVFFDRKSNQKLSRSDVLVLANHDTRSVNYRGTRYNQLTDPVVQELEESCLSAMSLEAVWINAKIPRATRSFVVSTAWVVILGMFNKLMSGFTRDKPVLEFTERDFRKLNEIFNLFHSGKNIDGDALVKQVEKWFYQKKYWLGILREVRPTVVIMVCYYCNAPLLWACKELGIKVYDLQHGVISDDHIGYGNLHNLSTTENTLIPDGFLCWDEGSADILRKWCKNTSIDIHVIGNPLHKLFADKEGKRADIVSHFSRIVNSAKSDGKMVLLTLQWGLDECIPKKLRSIIEQSPESWQWWVRLHPLQLGDPGGIREVKELQKNRGNVVFNEATTTPLPAILARADVHVTYTSSVVIEAEWHGVKSVMLNELSTSYYGDVISRGNAIYLCSGIEDMIKSIGSFNRIDGHTSQLGGGTSSLPDILNREIKQMDTEISE